MHIAPSAPHRYLVAMSERRMISYTDGVISAAKIELMTPEVCPATIVGSIPYGTPEEREAQIEEYLPLSVSVFGSRSFYVLEPPAVP